MGLEYVELLIDAEQEFGITIPDAAAEAAVTVGDFFDLVLALIRTNGPAKLRGRADLEQHVWTRVRALAARHGYDVRPEQVARETRFVEDLGYG